MTTPASGAGAPSAATSRVVPVAAAGAPNPRLTTPAGYDPGRHKRGTNPCGRRLSRGDKRRAKRRAEAEAAMREWADQQNASARLTDEQLGPRLAARRRDFSGR